jgi:membrane-bound metal-dependent hydrolase YbcI (DUF457 family)
VQGPAHLAIGWLIGERAGLAARRDRRLVGLAGLVPDVDVLVYPLAYLWYGADIDRAYAVYALVHHRYTHGIVFAALCMLGAWAVATPAVRGKVALLTLLAIAAHIAGDVIGSGPGWPVHPLWPASDLALGVSWSWNASDWRNIALSAAAIALTLGYARRRGFSPLECFSYRADDWLATVVRGQARSSPRFRLMLYGVLLAVSAVVVLPLLLYLR